MPVQALEPRRLYRQIADQLRELIGKGEFSVGARLPAERDLATQLKVSRTSVREALIALELGGLIEVRGGSGVYVVALPNDARPLFDTADAGPGPFELLHARKMVEGEIAALAAESIDTAGLAALEAIVRSHERVAHDATGLDDGDFQFHLGIAEATRNSALTQTVRLFWEMRRGPMWKKIVEHFHTPSLLAAVISDHHAILQALRDHAPNDARRAMHAHLERVEREFAKSWSQHEQPANERSPVNSLGRSR
jgi:GntR family uxuAB operon transcriptional repressor